MRENSKSATFDTTKEVDSVDAERIEKEKFRTEISLLDYEIKQLKLEISRKDAQALQKE